MSHEQSRSEQRWLLLIHQLPAKPAYFRVKIWRRLQGIGAVAVKNTVYALPANAETQEDFEWLLQEIVEGGGEAMMCEARLVDGLSDAQVRALFDAGARRRLRRDRQGGARSGRGAHGRCGRRKGGRKRGRSSPPAKRLAQVVAIDFFGANGRVAVEGCSPSSRPASRRTGHGRGPPKTAASRVQPNCKGRTWVTRRACTSTVSPAAG